MNDHPLDRPIWEALSTTHASWARGTDLAKRYPREISPLAALRDQSPQAYAAMGELLAPGEPGALFLAEPARPPKGWRLARSFEMEQMVCAKPPDLPRSSAIVESLGPDAVPEMLALAELTKPGPFRARTIEFGGYVGIKDGGRLVAMTGQRTRPAGYTEISAVCTHPDARGRGYAELLVAMATREVFSRGEIPFLEFRRGNSGAQRVYERLGYKIRRSLEFVSVERAIPIG